MTRSLKSVISCEVLNLPTPFDGACFGHVMNKLAQYARSLMTRFLRTWEWLTSTMCKHRFKLA